MTKNPHIGESFESFLRDEGILDKVTTNALKRLPAFASDDEAAQFCRTANLSEYDLSGTKAGRIGIATYEEIKARTLAIARGEIKPSSEDPKIWIAVDPKDRG